MGDYVEYTLRYLVDPRKARYVNSSIWKHILYAYQNGELVLYNKNYEYKNNDIVIVKEDTQKKTRKKKKEN